MQLRTCLPMPREHPQPIGLRLEGSYVWARIPLKSPHLSVYLSSEMRVTLNGPILVAFRMFINKSVSDLTIS